MNRGRHIEITVDGAVDEFDFKNVPAFAVPHGRNGARFNTLTRNVRDDGGRCRGWFGAKSQRWRET